jgi:hypothetical protein
VRRAVVLHGGQGPGGAARDGTWGWRDGAWSRVQDVFGAGPRFYHVMVYDAARTQLAMFGGGYNGYVRQTWVHRYGSMAVPADRCVAGEDTDGDMLEGCSDPDCWARCAPLCPPGLACDPTAAHCGDGACSVLEDRYLCPTDCS